MAENPEGMEKTEEPTARRLEEARERGQVARSQDLNAAVILLASMLLLAALGDGMGSRLVEFTRECFTRMADPAGSVEWFLSESPRWLSVLLIVLAPFMISLAVITYVLCLTQVGFMFTLKPLMPDFTKMMDPLSGIAKIFEKENAIRLLMTLGKTAIIVWVAAVLIGDNLNMLCSLGLFEFDSIFTQSAHLSFDLGVRIALVMLLLALLDWRHQRQSTRKQLMMTREEVKEETRNMEGDPKIRSRRRAMQMRLIRERMSRSVKDAKVVITNPVELAVAIDYDMERDVAPRVVAKGARLMAAHIKDLARENDVPIVVNRPLARALYEAVEVGEVIPEKLYKAVSEVLAYIWSADEMRRAS
ncbi:MAG: EscU/YscU/HrcU family type III secretion system export apparatus switch protein [Planctomycetota bacterium]